MAARPRPAPSPRALVHAQVALESFRLAPDGAFVISVLRRVVGGAYRSHLWLRAWRGGATADAGRRP